VKVLLTGSAGFIGSHVLETLAAAGHEVVAFDVRTGDDVRDHAALDRARPRRAC
jgi:dTDP-L-rhamnose 4-epimerase